MEALLQNQILPGMGIENVRLDMRAPEVYNLLKGVAYHDIEVKAIYPELFVYTVLNSLAIYINILTGLVVRIDLFNSYQGKTPQGIGIGSPVKSILASYEEVAFDESYLLIGKESELIITTDWEDDIYDLASIADKVVERIILEKKGWRMVAEDSLPG